LKGLVAAALLAALMGTVSGALNSIATLFSYDIYRRWRPDSSDKKLVIIGRIVTFIGMVVAIFWSPMISKFESVYQGCVAIISYIAPPITAVFLWGVLVRRISAIAATVTLYIGSLLGFIVFLLDWYKEQTRWNISFMMAGFYLFSICSFILFIVSYFKPHQHTEESTKLVWKNPLECIKSPGWKGIGNYKFLSAALFIIMVSLYIVFR
jgi:SSS family solute:Na+ symporter